MLYDLSIYFFAFLILKMNIKNTLEIDNEKAPDIL